jgi:hypothetical protein
MVKCKTEQCGWPLFLDIIGPVEKFKHAVVPPMGRFTITCPECKIPQSYGAFDVEEMNVENPPKDYRCREFLEAIRTA